MALRKLPEVRLGMRLAKPVMNPQGRLIAQAGETITDRHLRLFKSWGVPAVDIADPVVNPATPVWALPPEALESITRSIDERFAGRTGHPAMAEIARVAKVLLLQRSQAQPPRPALSKAEGEEADG
jgi:hypothetical protein